MTPYAIIKNKKKTATEFQLLTILQIKMKKKDKVGEDSFFYVLQCINTVFIMTCFA
jgi:hypothetical protein